MPSQSEISARLNGDNSNFRSMLNQSELAAKQSFGRLTKNLDLRDASRTMAAAVGLNIDSIAENFARMWTGVTKEAEDALQKIADISDKITELRLKRMEDRRTTGQQIQFLEKEALGLAQQRAEIEKSISWLTGRTGLERQLAIEGEAKLKQNEYEMELNINALIEARKKSQKEVNDELERFFAETDKRSSENYAAAANAANRAKSDAVELAAIKAADAEQRKEATANQAIETNKAHEEEMANLEETRKAALSVGEAIADGGVTWAEAQKRWSDAIAEDIRRIHEAWKDFTVSVTTFGRSDKELSDRELERKLQEVKNDIFQRELAVRNYGGLAGSSPYDPLLTEQQFNLQKLLNEIQLRSDVKQRAAVFGEDAAFNMFPGISESRFREILGNNTEQQKQTTILEEIRDQQKRGIVTVPIGN